MESYLFPLTRYIHQYCCWIVAIGKTKECVCMCCALDRLWKNKPLCTDPDAQEQDTRCDNDILRLFQTVFLPLYSHFSCLWIVAVLYLFVVHVGLLHCDCYTDLSSQTEAAAHTLPYPLVFIGSSSNLSVAVPVLVVKTNRLKRKWFFLASPHQLSAS